MNQQHQSQYFESFLPAHLNHEELTELAKIGIPVSLQIQSEEGMVKWNFQVDGSGFNTLPEQTLVDSTFVMKNTTFEQMVTGKLKPQWAFFKGAVKIHGNKLQALRIASLLDGIFKRIPWNPSQIEPVKTDLSVSNEELLSDTQKQIIDLHLNPKWGAPYWIEQSRKLGITTDHLQSIEDLAVFGAFDQKLAASMSYRSFVPKQVMSDAPHLILGETGGTLGSAMTSVWQPNEFHSAFLSPFLNGMKERKIDSLTQWLFVGPTGPHLIGKAADGIALGTTGIEALKIDFDPRWHRRLVPGSLAGKRHLAHLIEQVEITLKREYIDALFVTPSILFELFKRDDTSWLEKIKLIHLGGQSISLEQVEEISSHLSSGSHLINGYGNSLFGCLLEEPYSPLTYPFPSQRHVLRLVEQNSLVNQVAQGLWGRILCHRFDETMMLLNVLERDEAQHLGSVFSNPKPIETSAHLVQGGIY